MADDNQICDFGALADFIGDQSGIEKGLRPNILVRAGLAKVFENEFPPLIEDLAHFR
jgi:hypothetical protein